MTLNAAAVVVGPRVDIAFRRGTNVLMCTVNTVGRNGNESVFYTLLVRAWRKPDGTIVGHQHLLSNGVPAWSVAPVLDTTTNGVRLTVGADGPVWKSTVTTSLVTTI